VVDLVKIAIACDYIPSVPEGLVVLFNVTTWMVLAGRGMMMVVNFLLVNLGAVKK